MQDYAVIALLLGAAAGLAWAVRRVGGPPSLTDLFRFPQLGWPRGVQEDDDARWLWRPAAVPRATPTEHVHGHVHAGR